MKDFLRLWAAPLVIVVLGIVVALMFVAPAPPKRVVIAAGGVGGAYAQAAEAYAATLRDQKIDVEILVTAGSVENMQKLRSGDADIAIVQTGLAADLDTDGVTSLGAVFYEPLWLFHRVGLPIDSLRDLKGLRVAVGPEGSGVRVLSMTLLQAFGVAPGDLTAVPLAGSEAAAALVGGEVDAVLVVTGASAGWITGLIHDPGVVLQPMRHAPALARQFSYLDEVILPTGVLDLRQDLPSEDVMLIAPSAQIAVREALHPAIQSLLIEAAMTTHARGSLLAEPGRFPNAALADLPLSKEAERYYENGPSFLRRIFPYAVANFLERAWVLAIPLITLMFPLVRAAPPLYRWRIRRKIYIWYQDLRDLENAGRAAGSAEERADVRAKLADLQAETGKVDVPLSYTDDLYRLRAHITFVAELLDKLSAADRHARI